MTPANPLIVQGDYVILAEVASPQYEDARDRLIRFAELVKAPEHVHTYRLTPLSIWNARASGVAVEEMISALEQYSKYPVPHNVVAEVREQASRYGRVTLTRDDEGLLLTADHPALAEQIWRSREAGGLLEKRIGANEFRVAAQMRGEIKQALIKIGYPAEDVAGYSEGEPLPFTLSDELVLRPYQVDAADAFYLSGSARGGAGVIVLPCGAGKTVVGIAAMAQLQTSTLILTTSVTAVQQWADELVRKTSLEREQIAMYTGERKDVGPVTIATYQIMSYRARKGGDFPHLSLFDQRNWGLIIYDEVHLLPAPVFRVTASLQARRRLGLTATLVREDGREEDVFALIGPKKADVPWKTLEQQGWIATAVCTEIRLPLPEPLKMEYALAEARDQFRIASENPAKLHVVRALLGQHPDEPTLIIGLYVEQLESLAKELNIPLLTGETSQRKRDQLFGEFKSGRLRVLAVSKIANFAIDLPDASLAIQISGTFGSRQEEAQRLGRILRPKSNGQQAHFYTIVTRDTVEQDFAMRRQLFLAEQGYAYEITDFGEQ